MKKFLNRNYKKHRKFDKGVIMYDIIIVGSGFCGSVIADKAASMGKKVLLLEKRNHIAGNMYDEKKENGILVQKYGPHIFHTNNKKVYGYLIEKGEWWDYKLHYGVDIDGRCISAPFGFHTVKELYDAKKAECIINAIQNDYDGDSITILEMLKSNNSYILEFAQDLYKKNYLPYALKQWNLEPGDLDPSVIGRMPVIFSERKYYFTDKYEMLPLKGFTVFFKKLLENKNIELMINTDATKLLSLLEDTCEVKFNGESVSHIPVVYTGSLEYLLTPDHIRLPFRSLRFDYIDYEETYHQEKGLITYPQRFKYIRSTDYNFLMHNPVQGHTTVSYEYPIEYKEGKGTEPYYPILTADTIKINDFLQKKIAKFKNFFPCGRLADYKYYNMDQAIERALEVFKEIESKYWRK